MREGRNGWTSWVYPEPEGYFLKCCDCGLVHELNFKTFVEVPIPKRDLFQVVELPWPFRVMFRARRVRK